MEGLLDAESGRDPENEPPSCLDPAPGDTVPTGKTCEACGTLCEWWVYNPFSSRGVDGWVKQPGCACAREAEKKREAELFKFERGVWDTGLDQRDLDAAFGKPNLWRKTFDRFSVTNQPKMKAVKEVALAFGESLGELPMPERGLLLVGPVSTGKKHLLAAIAHQARRLEVTVLCLAVPRALETTDPAHWSLLGQVTLLCLSDLLLHPLLPSELRRLDSLLTTREEGRLPTCFSAPLPPTQLAARYPAQKEAVGAVLARAGRMADLVAAPPSTPAFTSRMESALR